MRLVYHFLPVRALSKIRFTRVFLPFIFLFYSNTFVAQSIVLNEVSQGPSGTKEYVELLVTWTPTCVTSLPCIDLRGYYIDDNNGTFASGSGMGIASGCMRFTNDALWSCVPVGTIILIYNDGDKNASIPADDYSLTDGNCVLVLPANNTTYFEGTNSTPSTSTSAYPTSGFTAGGNWSSVGMANGGDSFQIRDASANLLHAVSWGNNTTANIVYMGSGSQGGMVSFMGNVSNNNPASSANWISGSAGTDQTPGAANNAANATWINSMNFSCSTVTPLTASISATPPPCGGTGSATVTAGGSIGPYTYSWTPSGGSGVSVSGLAAGDYTATVTSSMGCTQTATISIAAAGSFTPGITSSDVTCNGSSTGTSSISISGGSGPYTYTWAPAGGSGSTASGLLAGTYSCTIHDGGTGCDNTVTTIINEPAAISITSIQTNVLCNGGSTGIASISAMGGTPSYSYSWAPAGGTSATAASLTAGTYTCTVTDANSCQKTQIIAITEPTAISIVPTQTDVLCNGGATGVASVSASGGTPSYSYSWAPTGGTTATVSSLTAGTYTCVVTDTSMCQKIQTIIIAEPSSISITPTQTNVPCNGYATGTAAVSVLGGAPSYTYAWAPAGGTSATAASLAAGTYTCTVTDMNSCQNTQIITITEPTILSANNATTDAFCGSANGSATVSVSGGTSPYTYSINNGGFGASDIFNNLVPGSYTIGINDANNCAAATIATINNTGTISINANSPTICPGDTAPVTVSGASSYTWTPSAGLSSVSGAMVNASPPSTTVYTINASIGTCTAVATSTVTVNSPSLINAFGQSVCYGNPASLNASGAGTYTWSPAAGLSTNTGASVTTSIQSTTIYTVTATDVNGCTSTDTALIEIIPLPIISVNSSTICANGTATLSAAGASSFTWSTGNNGPVLTVSPNISSLYSVNGTDNNGCQGTGSAAVTVNPNPDIIVNGNTVVCQGYAVTLVAAGASSYTWSTGSMNNSISVSPGGNTTYTVAGTDNNRCTNFNTITVTVSPTPSVSINPQSSTGCAPLCQTFTSTVSPAGGAYSWNFGEGGVSNYSSPEYCYTKEGTYSVMLVYSNSNGCSDSARATINVLLTPVADFIYSPSEIDILSPQVSFTNLSGNASQWVWSFGDLIDSVSHIKDPLHSYASTGNYPVQLIAIAGNGCADTIVKYITVEEDFALYIPSAFSPNNDGINDVFKATGVGISEFHLYIFDRWGNQVFHSNNLETGWDGTHKGSNIVQEDVYVWKAQAVTNKNQKKEMNGTVTLIR